MKLVTKYEVEGAWTDMTREVLSKCRCCGAELEPVPKEGHYNSKYHYLKQDDGLDLACCPNGCSEALAKATMRKFLAIQTSFLTKESKSFKWTIDYAQTDDFWISPEGIIYPIMYGDHWDFLYRFSKLDERDAELAGWVKVSNRILVIHIPMNQKQFDAAFDLFVAKNWDFTEVSEYFTEGESFAITIRNAK